MGLWCGNLVGVVISVHHFVAIYEEIWRKKNATVQLMSKSCHSTNLDFGKKLRLTQSPTFSNCFLQDFSYLIKPLHTGVTVFKKFKIFLLYFKIYSSGHKKCTLLFKFYHYENLIQNQFYSRLKNSKNDQFKMQNF